MIVSPRTLSRQLTPLGEIQADIVTTLAAGADGTLAANPFFRQAIASQTFLAIAALYGSALAVAQSVADEPVDEDDAAGKDAAERARLTLASMEQIVALTRVPAPREAPGGFEEMMEKIAAMAGDSER